jgi:hypothetical protein
MFAAFWPFDWSFDGFCFICLMLFWWFAWSIGSAAKDTAKAVKKIAENETVQEAGKGILGAWLESLRK